MVSLTSYEATCDVIAITVLVYVTAFVGVHLTHSPPVVSEFKDYLQEELAEELLPPEPVLEHMNSQY